MEVIVQDANNIVIEVDQGRQGRGIDTVSLVTVGADYYLEFTFTDGSTEQVGPVATTVTEVISAEVRNAEAVTILKGQPVYLFQAQGNLATVKLAFNTSDATSAKTLGLAAENIAPGAQGLVTCQGTLGGLNTSAYNEGDTLYLGATAGTLTNVKPQAPNHLVYIGVVERANAGAGQIYVRVQNGYELDEIHDVRIISPVNGNTLIYDATTSLWKNAGITAGSGISVTNGPGSISVGNTGVLSVSGGTTGLTPATATTGAVTLAGTLATTNGGTGLTSFTANRVLYTSSTSAIGQSANLTFDGSNLGIGTSSPAYKLDVAGSTATARFGKLLVLDDSPFLTGANINSGSNPLAIGGGAGNSVFAFFVNNAEQMRLTSTGLGIGTSAPNTKLDITTTANNGIRLFQTGAANAWNIYTSGNNLRFIEENVGAVMSINAGGNVGIGTTSPGSRLDVQGTSVVSSFLSSNNNNVIRLRGNNAANGAWLGTTNTDDFIFSNGATIAERMRIDASGNLGIGTTLPGTKLDVAGVDGQGIQFRTASRTIGIGQVSSEAAVYWGSGTALTFSSAAVERARIDSSGNLLVGTTTNTNSSRLTVNGTISETVSAVQYLVASQFDVGTAPNKIPLNQYLGNLAYQNASAIAGQAGFAAGTAALPSIASATDLTTGRWFPAAGVMAWSTSGVERMRLDASGNLGVAVVPSVNNGGAALQIGTVTALMGNSSESWVNNNATFNSGWKYIANGFASNYHQLSGTHRWNIAPSGTAGNAISFTQAMTLDASGRLLIGSSSSFSSAAKLQVQDNIALELNGTGGKFEFFSFGVSRGFISAPAITGLLNIGATSVFSVQTVSSERLRITDSGNQISFQSAEYAQNTSATLAVGVLQNRIVTSNAAVTLTLPTGTDLEGYTASMATNTAFECTFIATTANAITIAANGNTTVGSLTVAGNTSGTFRFRKTAANTFTVYRVA